MQVVLLCLLGGYSVPEIEQLGGLRLFSEVDENDNRLTALYDHLLIPNYQLLSGIANVIRDGQVPVYKSNHYGQFNPDREFEQLKFRERLRQSQILICESFVEYLILLAFGDRNLPPSAGAANSHSKPNVFFLDEMAVEMNKFAKTRSSSLYLIFLSQVFIDINAVLGRKAQRGVLELRQECGRMLGTLERRARIESARKPDTWPAENKSTVEAFVAEVKVWHTTDPITTLRNKVAPLALRHNDYESMFIKRNPMLCGLLLFRLQMEYQDIGFTRMLRIQFSTRLISLSLVATPRVLTPTACFDRHATAAVSAQPNRHFRMEAKGDPSGLKDHTQMLPIFKRKYLVERLLSDIGAHAARGEQSKHSEKPTSVKLRRKRAHKSPKYSVVQTPSHSGGRSHVGDDVDPLRLHRHAFTMLSSSQDGTGFCR
ncbi:hypothetical protein BCR39DRAFT_591193 [Naematelia encephala]|uniref:Uncharacterized protein n=1 Tax=Naematelia encephala TaxID=71784 RepID=A0A1Y2AK23_9TREE|nr:hypothetical protein BCR39DRAFT_591193 [Naematelia encephala]